MVKFTILHVPALFFRRAVVVVFTDDATSIKVVGHFLNDAQKFQLLGVVCGDGIAAQQTTHDVTADGSGGITVSGVVNAAHDGLLKGVPVLGNAVDSDCECLMACPASADGFDGVVVFDVRSGQIKCLLEESLLLPDLIRP